MIATVPHVTSGSGLRKFQADGFLFNRVYKTGGWVEKCYSNSRVACTHQRLLTLNVLCSLNLLLEEHCKTTDTVYIT